MSIATAYIIERSCSALGLNFSVIMRTHEQVHGLTLTQTSGDTIRTVHICQSKTINNTCVTQ